jgi:hypothetical protein
VRIRARAIAIANVANVGDLADVSDYVVSVSEGENPISSTPPPQVVNDFPTKAA